MIDYTTFLDQRRAFATGEARILVTKSKIAGQGLNQLHAQARAAMRRHRQLGDDWRIAESERRPLALPQWLRRAA